MDLFTDEKLETRVSLESRDQNDFIVSRSDPHGYWIIKREKGPIPDSLKGLYTKREFALQAVRTYLNTFALPRPIKEIKDVLVKSK